MLRNILFYLLMLITMLSGTAIAETANMDIAGYYVDGPSDNPREIMILRMDDKTFHFIAFAIVSTGHLCGMDDVLTTDDGMNFYDDSYEQRLKIVKTDPHTIEFELYGGYYCGAKANLNGEYKSIYSGKEEKKRRKLLFGLFHDE